MMHPFAGAVATTVPVESSSRSARLDSLELEEIVAGLNKGGKKAALTSAPDGEEGGQPGTSKPQLESGRGLSTASR